MQNKNITDITMDGSFLAPYSHEFKYIRNRNRNGADKKKSNTNGTGQEPVMGTRAKTDLKRRNRDGWVCLGYEMGQCSDARMGLNASVMQCIVAFVKHHYSGQILGL